MVDSYTKLDYLKDNILEIEGPAILVGDVNAKVVEWDMRPPRIPYPESFGQIKSQPLGDQVTKRYYSSSH